MGRYQIGHCYGFDCRLRSSELLSFLQYLQAEPEVSPAIIDVRGKGLMIAVEFASPSYPGGKYDFELVSGNAVLNVAESLASRVTKKCVEKGLLLLTTSVYQVVRFIQPFTCASVC